MKNKVLVILQPLHNLLASCDRYAVQYSPNHQILQPICVISEETQVGNKIWGFHTDKDSYCSFWADTVQSGKQTSLITFFPFTTSNVSVESKCTELCVY